MKERLNIYIPLFIILNLIFLGIPQHLIAQDNQIDNKLITAARSKANGMGHNPITLYTDENGHVVFTEGNMLTIRNGKSGIAEGDMVVNVGQRDANVGGTILKKGEYGVVVKNGKFEKASDRIGEIRRSSYLWLIVLVGIGSMMVFFVIAKRKKRNVTSDNSRIQPQAISSPEKLENKPPQQNNPFSEKILNFLDENPLSIGIFDEFKKGQEDFSNWGDGVLTGSKEWVVNKLCNKLSEIGVSNPPSIRRTQNYQWQTSNLEGFTARIEASLPNMLAGYYIGRIGDNLYGLFGCNFNKNETENPAPTAVKSIKLNETADTKRGISVSLVALRWDSNPISKQELRDRAAIAVQVVDSQFDKDVMDVKILVIDEKQQYVQLSVRADFRDKAEEEQMREALKTEFIK